MTAEAMDRHQNSKIYYRSSSTNQRSVAETYGKVRQLTMDLFNLLSVHMRD